GYDRRPGRADDPVDLLVACAPADGGHHGQRRPGPVVRGHPADELGGPGNGDSLEEAGLHPRPDEQGLLHPGGIGLEQLLKGDAPVSYKPEIGSLVGVRTYRSFLADPDLATAFNALEFGRGNIRVDDAPMGILRGRIYDTGWALELSGSIQYGT